MASVDWKKIKTSAEFKAIVRHNDGDKREMTNHSNKQINKSKTYLNTQTASYDNVISKFDSRHEELLQYKKANKRTDRVHAVSLSIPTPEGLNKRDERDWFLNVEKLIKEKLDIKESDVMCVYEHYDEIHEYIDSLTSERKMSRAHMHFMFIPTAKDADGCDKLNANAVVSRSNMVAINNAIEDMTFSLYHVHFMDGSKRKGKQQSLLKNESDGLKHSEALQTLESITNELEEQKRVNGLLNGEKEALKRERDTLFNEKERIRGEYNELVRTHNGLVNGYKKLEAERDALKNVKVSPPQAQPRRNQISEAEAERRRKMVEKVTIDYGPRDDFDFSR